MLMMVVVMMVMTVMVMVMVIIVIVIILHCITILPYYDDYDDEQGVASTTCSMHRSAA